MLLAAVSPCVTLFAVIMRKKCISSDGYCGVPTWDNFLEMGRLRRRWRRGGLNYVNVSFFNSLNLTASVTITLTTWKYSQVLTFPQKKLWSQITYGSIYYRLVPAQDGPFSYTRSHLSALQNCALLFSINFYIIFILKEMAKRLDDTEALSTQAANDLSQKRK